MFVTCHIICQWDRSSRNTSSDVPCDDSPTLKPYHLFSMRWHANRTLSKELSCYHSNSKNLLKEHTKGHICVHLTRLYTPEMSNFKVRSIRWKLRQKHVMRLYNVEKYLTDETLFILTNNNKTLKQIKCVHIYKCQKGLQLFWYRLHLLHIHELNGIAVPGSKVILPGFRFQLARSDIVVAHHTWFNKAVIQGEPRNHVCIRGMSTTPAQTRCSTILKNLLGIPCPPVKNRGFVRLGNWHFLA